MQGIRPRLGRVDGSAVKFEPYTAEEIRKVEEGGTYHTGRLVETVAQLLDRLEDLGQRVIDLEVRLGMPE